MSAATSKVEGKTTVGLAFLGDMGQAVASALRTRGVRVLTTLEGRSPETAARARQAEVETVNSFADLVREADVFIALAPPAAAMDLAEAWIQLSDFAPPRAVYVDASSIGPELAREIGEKVQSTGRSFVDAAINGLAANFTTSGTLFLSGGRADEVAAMFEGAARVRSLGVEPGRASAMKMLLSGVSKGICALHVELALTAHRLGMLEEMSTAVDEIYPGVARLVERMLPTYAAHAGRRATEMAELQSTVSSTGVEPTVIEAIRRLHEALAAVEFEPADGASAAALVERLASVESSDKARGTQVIAANAAVI